MATSRFPLPERTGDRLRALRQVEFLAQTHEVHWVCLSRVRVSAADQADMRSRVASLQIIEHGWREIGANVLRGFTTDLPVQTQMFRSPEMTAAISRLIADEQIDVVISQLARVAPNVEPGTAAHVVDFVDALSLGLDRRIEAGTTWPMRAVLRREADRMRVVERRQGTRADDAVVTSHVDAAHLEAVGAGPVKVVPVGVSDDFCEERKRLGPIDAAHDLLFTGNLGYASNVVAAEFLVNQVLPLIRLVRPQTRLALVGARPALRVRRLASDAVDVLGPVPDLRPYMRKARVAIAPMQTGSGVQLKLLESMAMGLPMVTTPLASEPIGAVAGRDLLVGSTADQLARATISLLGSPDRSLELGLTGQQMVHDKYRWANLNANFEQILVAAAAARAKDRSRNNR